MTYFSVCPICKATLDPGEHCDCERKEKQAKREQEAIKKRIKVNQSTGQCYFPIERECRKL